MNSLRLRFLRFRNPRYSVLAGLWRRITAPIDGQQYGDLDIYLWALEEISELKADPSASEFIDLLWLWGVLTDREAPLADNLTARLRTINKPHVSYMAICRWIVVQSLRGRNTGYNTIQFLKSKIKLYESSYSKTKQGTT